MAVIPDFFKQDFSPHLVIAPNAGIAAYSSWLPTIVCLWYSEHLSLTVCICLAVLTNLPRSCYLCQWTKNWIGLVYFSFLSILLVARMSISGANKGDKCPSRLLRLLWRSLSSWSLLHKHYNWSSSHISCMSMLLHCFSLFSLSLSLSYCIIAFKIIEFCCLIWFDSKWCFCLVDSIKPIQAANGGWEQCSISSLL